jgi:predicted metal-dependent HD superfamily phosphohydrolase
MNDVMRRQWHDLLSGWSVDPALADQTFEEVRAHYAGPGRFYHTLDHVQNVLQAVESLGSFARSLNAVKLAVWLHDVICDSRASDLQPTLSPLELAVKFAPEEKVGAAGLRPEVDPTEGIPVLN